MSDVESWLAASAAASNDLIFRAHRGRTVPIPDTLTSVPGYPEKLRIYRIAASRYWQVRCWFDGKTYSKSLRTTSKQNAMALAKRFFDATAAAVHLGRDPESESGSPGFTQVAERLFQQEAARQRRGEFSRGSLQVMRNRLNAHILPQLGSLPVRAVDYAALQTFADSLGREGFTTTTISQYLVITTSPNEATSTAATALANASNVTTKTTTASVGYNLGVARLGAGISNVKNNAGLVGDSSANGATDTKAYMLTATVPMGAARLMANVGERTT